MRRSVAKIQRMFIDKYFVDTPDGETEVKDRLFIMVAIVKGSRRHKRDFEFACRKTGIQPELVGEHVDDRGRKVYAYHCLASDPSALDAMADWPSVSSIEFHMSTRFATQCDGEKSLTAQGQTKKPGSHSHDKHK